MSKNEITVTAKITLDSREVAKMVEKNHKELLRDIRGYVENMENSNERRIAPVDFFKESTYTDGKGENRPCYLITRKDCEFIANKLTGQKGTLFTATYINRFHEMESGLQTTPKLPTDKSKRLEIQEKNARAKTASIYLRIADNNALPKGYRGIFLNYASKELSGQDLLPLPKSERRTYSATEIGAMFRISPNRVGRIASEHNLKTPQFGMLYHDKSRHSVKEVDTFRYYDTVIPKFEGILGVKAGAAV